jgi:16S rRNA C1402 N4-methylase RsmH
MQLTAMSFLCASILGSRRCAAFVAARGVPRRAHRFAAPAATAAKAATPRSNRRPPPKKRSRKGGVDDAGEEAGAELLPPLPFADAYHTPVMAAEVISALVWDPAGCYVDGTLGGGGHALGICDALAASGAKGGRLIGVDKDPEALANAAGRLAGHAAEGRFAALRSDFRRLRQALAVAASSTNDASSEASCEASSDDGGRLLAGLVPADGLGVHGLLLDLGVSSHQLDEASRGFSYGQDGPLDMRMASAMASAGSATAGTSGSAVGSAALATSPSGDGGGPVSDADVAARRVGLSHSPLTGALTAAVIVNSWPVEALAKVLFEFGEEPHGRRIASKLAEARPLTTTAEVVERERKKGSHLRARKACECACVLRARARFKREALGEESGA